MNTLRMTLARILSSVDLAMLGRRIGMLIYDKDPANLKEEDLEKIAIGHAMELLEECAKCNGDIVSKTISKRALMVFMLKTDVNVHLQVSWELQNHVAISYSADTCDMDDYLVEVNKFLKRTGYDIS